MFTVTSYVLLIAAGRWNDKTLVTYDDLLRGIFEGNLYSDIKFKLQQKDGTEVEYQGVWVITDNGYLPWPTTVPPMKAPSTYEELRWSKWIESLRKDVECCFGILKGR